MNNITMSLLGLLFLGIIGYAFYYLNFVMPRKVGVPYFIHFEDVTNAPDLSKNDRLKGKIQIIMGSKDHMNWELKSTKVNERFIKQVLREDYNLTDKQVKITGEARWTHENN